MLSQAPNEKQSPQRALVVGKDRLISTVVSNLLMPLGYAPISVATGTEVIRLLNGGSFSLIFAAYEGLPINGLALYDFLRERQESRAIPFVLMADLETSIKLTSTRTHLPAMISPPFGHTGLQRAIELAKDPNRGEKGGALEI